MWSLASASRMLKRKMGKYYYYLFEEVPVVLMETGSMAFQESFKLTLKEIQQYTKVNQYSHIDGIYIGNFKFMNDNLLAFRDRAIYVNESLIDDTTAQRLVEMISEITLKEFPSGLMKDIIWGEVE